MMHTGDWTPGEPVSPDESLSLESCDRDVEDFKDDKEEVVQVKAPAASRMAETESGRGIA